MIHKWVEKGASITLGLKLYYASSSNWYIVELDPLVVESMGEDAREPL
jgi:hypothetical protein